MPDLVLSGALAHIDTLHLDWHLQTTWQNVTKAKNIKQALQLFTGLGQKLGLTKVALLGEDETFADFVGPLPQC